MILIPGLVSLLLVLTADARLGDSSETTVCTETKECLLYDRVCDESENANYEVRYYSSLKWVSTDESGLLMEAPTINAFHRLFKYITGTNEQSAKIDMTSPVIIKKINKSWNSNVYTMSFLLPSEHQANPPTPTDEKCRLYTVEGQKGGDQVWTPGGTPVYFTDMPDMKVYVRSYGGWMSSWKNWFELYYLQGDLNKAGAKYNNEFSYAVGYDSPMKILNRHNEVWYVVEGEHVCST